ncbi:Thioredoxin (fragment) [Tenacibaculum litopenaei]|jgi:thiol-disulfide isomerase/thioredoxin|uniref:TlpA disulfide reductase family protein n=1 Tax=Tenacibaculum litopenaei TaxID=396016 RepID=UPI0038933DE7
MNKFLILIGFLTTISYGQSNKYAEVTALSSVDFEGLKPHLTTQSDSTYIVNFWATWCKPCVEELPLFESISKRYKKKKVAVILVSLDFPKHRDTALLEFIKKHQLQSEVIHLDDPKEQQWIPKVDPNWTGSIPATLIYDAKKRKFYEQTFKKGALENELINFLK